jgi:hypothetical protein
MEELIVLSNSFMCDPRQTDDTIAHMIAQWALPDDHYDEIEMMFEPSGSPLEAFIDIVCFAREAPYYCEYGFYELCS